MKKRLSFFFLGFFSHSLSREGKNRGYTSTFLGFILAIVLLWSAFVGADMLPFGVHYKNSPDLKETVYAVLANQDEEKRIDVIIEDGALKFKRHGGDTAPALLVNTLDNEIDRQAYSVNGFNIVVDSRPAETPAEFEAYCISNDGNDTVISYEDYLSLSEVARLNFDFKLRYTGKELVLTDEAVTGYLTYLKGLTGKVKERAMALLDSLSKSEITKADFNRKIYELYFESYYPDITAYEASSKVPLLRNYYYHEYIKTGLKGFLFIFNDYMAGSFQTEGGIEVSFNGFYSELSSGALIKEGATQDEARAAVDGFIKNSFGAITSLNLYAQALNVFSLIPFIALMLAVVTVLAYSIMRIRGVESIGTLGAMLKIVGSYAWFSGAVAAVVTVVISFFINRDALGALPQVFFFVTLLTRSVVFALKEIKLSSEKASTEAGG